MSILSWLKSRTMKKPPPRGLKIDVTKYPCERQLDPKSKRIVDRYLEKKAAREKQAAEAGTVKEELVTQAERFHQSFYEFIERLRSYDVRYYHSPLSPLGAIKYGDCIRRSVEEMRDELHQIEGLLSGGPRQAIGSPAFEAQRKACDDFSQQ